MGSEMAPLGLKNPKVILKLTFDFRESFALIVSGISTKYFPFPLPCEDRRPRSTLRQVRRPSLQSEIAQ